mgnify:FL=1
MTLLTICQDAADELQLTRPNSIVGNLDDDVRRLLRYANKVGKGLLRRAHLSALRKERAFTAVAGETQTGILPDDFDRFVPEAVWDRTNKNLIAGPVTATQWQGLKTYGYTDTENPKFAYRGGNVLLQPDMGGGESLAFEYVSNGWALTAVGGYSDTWTLDTDVSVIDDELTTYGVILEWLLSESLPIGKTGKDFQDLLKTLIKNDQPTSGILAAADIWGRGRHFDGAPAVSGSSIYNY